MTPAESSARPPLPGALALSRAFREFVGTEIVGGAVLLVATTVALVWANSPWQAGYSQLWRTELVIGLGRWHFGLDLREWVNEGLMAVFFVVVGLEVKRELLLGELREPRRAALPVVAAVGGMVAPALLYTAFNVGGVGARGWGIPMATDIAFALGVLALVAPRLPGSLRLFLLTLAIVDDIGAIVVIAAFYSRGVQLTWLAVAVGVLIVAFVLRRRGLVYAPLFVALGVSSWLAMHAAGVHATIAGVAMGLLAPAQPSLDREIVLTQADELLDVYSPTSAQTTSQLARLSVSRLEWLEHGLHPWSSLLIVPLFALANAGVALSTGIVRDAVGSPVTIGVVVGLVAGKSLGITAASWLACRFGHAELPQGVGWRQLAGVAALGGIGFTVSLFVTDLAFKDPAVAGEAKVGILFACVGAAALACALLRGKRSGPAPAPCAGAGSSGGRGSG